MMLPQNRFKRGLREGRQQIGLWNSLPGTVVALQLVAAGASSVGRSAGIEPAFRG